MTSWRHEDEEPPRASSTQHHNISNMETCRSFQSEKCAVDGQTINDSPTTPLQLFLVLWLYYFQRSTAESRLKIVLAFTP